MEVDLNGLQVNILACISLKHKQERYMVEKLVEHSKLTDVLEPKILNRSFALTSAIGHVQKGQLPELEAINTWREAMGWDTITQEVLDNERGL